jgi:hypothetical protein
MLAGTRLATEALQRAISHVATSTDLFRGLYCHFWQPELQQLQSGQCGFAG